MATSSIDHVARTGRGRKELISIVVPVFNEEDNIRPLYDSVRAELDELWHDYELIFVDDGSTDGSVEVIRHLHQQDPRVRLVALSRNFGHQVALTAGLEHAGGAAVIVMDADLQHPPVVIRQLVQKWKEGFDVVSTVREATKGVGLFKRITAAAFYRLINTLVDTPIVANAADFRLMDRKVVDCMNGMRERNRFVRGLVSWVGFRQIAVPYVAGQRQSGQTKYSLTKMLRFAVDGITSFSTVPLRVAAYLGFLVALSVVPYAVWAVYLKLFTNQAVAGWPSLIVAVLFLGGVQLICLGVLGEYIGRIYEEVKGRPLYVAREFLGISDSEKAGGQGNGRPMTEQSRKPAASVH